jgi:hypothetical protein
MLHAALLRIVLDREPSDRPAGILIRNLHLRFRVSRVMLIGL